MPAQPRHTADDVIAAIHKNNGYVSKIAADLQVSTSTVYNYRDRWVTVAQAWADVREKRHDFVESKLDKAINGGNITAIIFYLKTQCKNRGWVERFEHTGPDNSPVEIVVRYADPQRDAAEAA